jgi:protoporphyrinogen oxidase
MAPGLRVFLLANVRHKYLGWAGLVNAKTYQLLHPQHSVVLLDQNESLGGTVRIFPGRELSFASLISTILFTLKSTS